MLFLIFNTFSKLWALFTYSTHKNFSIFCYHYFSFSFMIFHACSIFILLFVLWNLMIDSLNKFIVSFILAFVFHIFGNFTPCFIFKRWLYLFCWLLSSCSTFKIYTFTSSFRELWGCWGVEPFEASLCFPFAFSSSFLSKLLLLLRILFLSE